MNKFKEDQCSVRVQNTDSKVHGSFKLVQAGKPVLTIQVLLLRFSLRWSVVRVRVELTILALTAPRSAD